MEKKRSSPLARRLAKLNNISLDIITGTGPGGRIVARDLETFSSQPSVVEHPAPSITAPAPAAIAAVTPPPAGIVGTDADASYEIVPLDNMQRTIARRLTEAKQMIPHIYLSIDCELTRLLEARRLLNEHQKDVKVSVNDFLIKCAASALIQVPDVNVSFSENGILKYKTADISVAVAIDGGLITPIVKRAHTKGIVAISQEMRDLAQRARARRLKPHEFEGGTFSISNLGMYGINFFSAIINPPQGAILAIGQSSERVVVKDGQMAIASMMTATLSCDHRAINGVQGAQFLQAFKRVIECPSLMLG